MLEALDETRVAQLQVVVPDALAAGEQAVGKLARRQARVARYILEPLHTVARCALQLEYLDTALFLVGAEGCLQVRRAGYVARERDGILHRELGAGADREVCGVRGVADQHHPPVVPATAGDTVEVQPGRAAQVAGIALQSRSAEVLREQALAECD